LNGSFKELSASIKTPILLKILKYGIEINEILSFKNFEAMLMHNME
jgi:hypothetical protein